MGVLRFLLALSVVVQHLDGTFGTHSGILPGTIAVQIFFAISGFYMSLILSGKYHSRTTFYVNRALRLYPVYIIICLATWAWFFFVWWRLGRTPTNSWTNVYWHMPIAERFLIAIPNWTMLGLDLPTLFHFDPAKGFLLFHYPAVGDAPDGAKWAGELLTINQAWSVGDEIWFYLLAPFIMAWRSRWIFAIGLASVGLRALMAARGLSIYFFFPAQLVFFMAGILLHRLYASLNLDQKWRRVALIVMAALAAEFLLFGLIPKSIAPYVVYATFIPAIPVLFWLTKSSLLDKRLGNLSYPIYLVHMLVIAVVVTVTRHMRLDVAAIFLIYAVVVLLVIVISEILHQKIEAPVDRLRQNLAARGAMAVGRAHGVPIVTRAAALETPKGVQ